MGLKEFRDLQAQKEERKTSEGLQGEFLSLDTAKKIAKLEKENKQLKEKIDYLKNKIENKDKWCQLIADIGYDYDGYRQADSLMSLIDELVKYAIWSRDNYDYDVFQKE